MIVRSLLTGLALLSMAAPLAAQDDAADRDQLERRLRACLTSGSAGAPRDSLQAAVIAVRSLCYTQIRRLEDLRLGEVDRRFGLPEAELTAAERERWEDARTRERRALNHEIAMAISNFTGLAQ